MSEGAAPDHLCRSDKTKHQVDALSRFHHFPELAVVFSRPWAFDFFRPQAHLRTRSANPSAAISSIIPPALSPGAALLDRVHE